MIFDINNGKIELLVNDKGGEMMSIKYQNAEYLWQGDATYWKDRAINLFPITGRLKDGTYSYNDKIYKMDIHGFVRRSDLTCIEKTDTKLVFELKSNKLTHIEYPFDFSYTVSYELKDNSILITYTVKNLQGSPLYFCIGGHPGFNVPLNGTGIFSDYYLDFKTVEPLKKIGFNSACLITGENIPYPLKNGKILPLSHDLFDNDAIFLENMSSEVTLKSPKSTRSIMVNYNGFTYLGLWHKPKSNAPYICIEPWTALPSYFDHIDELTTKKDVIKLEKYTTYTLSWSISLT